MELTKIDKSLANAVGKIVQITDFDELKKSALKLAENQVLHASQDTRNRFKFRVLKQSTLERLQAYLYNLMLKGDDLGVI
jgi:hypothetical protein